MNMTEYLLTCLGEELAEVQQETSKCLRFTPNHKPTAYQTTNLERLQLEVADVVAIGSMLAEEDILIGISVNRDSLKTAAMRERFDDKVNRTMKLMHVSVELGALKVV